MDSPHYKQTQLEEEDPFYKCPADPYGLISGIDRTKQNTDNLLKNYATANTNNQSLEVKTDEYETNKPTDNDKK